MTYTFAQEVEGNFGGKGAWYPGKVMGIRDDGTFDLMYDDGDGESEVPADRVRPRGSGDDAGAVPAAATAAVAAAAPARQPASAGPAAAFSVHEVVEVKFRGKTWRAATITAIDEELGSVDVSYLDDGLAEKGTPLQMVRKAAGSGPAPQGQEAAVGGKPEKKEKKEKKDKKSKLKPKVQAVVDLLLTFTDTELDASLSMLLALDSVRPAPISAPMSLGAISSPKKLQSAE